MASVPTGMPAGIWTVDSSESMPLSAFDWIGTPSTGKRVSRRAHPGEVSRPACSGDEDLESTLLGPADIFLDQAWRPMRGHYVDLVRDPERVQSLGRIGHGLPVGLRSHDDTHQRASG